LIEKMAHFDRKVIPERRLHAKGLGAYGTFTVTEDITRHTRANIFSKTGKKTPLAATVTISASSEARNRKNRLTIHQISLSISSKRQSIAPLEALRQ
jgi:catalase